MKRITQVKCAAGRSTQGTRNGRDTLGQAEIQGGSGKYIGEAPSLKKEKGKKEKGAPLSPPRELPSPCFKGRCGIWASDHLL